MKMYVVSAYYMCLSKALLMSTQQMEKGEYFLSKVGVLCKNSKKYLKLLHQLSSYLLFLLVTSLDHIYFTV